jgi:hypothetical protein
MNSPTHIYYDLSVYNYDPDGTTPEKPFNYLEIKPQDFISNPNDYYLSITRFSIETSVLPVFIPQMVLNQSDPTKTIYMISMDAFYQNDPDEQPTSYSVNISYESLNPNYTPQVPVSLDDNNSNPYYYVYTYQQWIDSVNKALTTCYNGLKAQVPDNTLSNNPPFLQFDPTSFLCTLFGDAAFFDDAIDQTSHVKVKLYFNSPLMNLFRAFPARFLGHQTQAPKNWQLMFYATNNGSNTTTFETYSALTMFQERESVSLWNPIMSIVFMSNHLQPVPTYTGVPQSNTNMLSLGQNNNFANILTDFQVALSKDNGYNGIIYFAAVNPEERMLDLTYSGSGLNTVDLQVYWKSRSGTLVPLNLHSNCYASVKLLFRKKDFNNSS